MSERIHGSNEHTCRGVNCRPGAVTGVPDAPKPTAMSQRSSRTAASTSRRGSPTSPTSPAASVAADAEGSAKPPQNRGRATGSGSQPPRPDTSAPASGPGSAVTTASECAASAARTDLILPHGARARYRGPTAGAGFEVSLKFLQSFSETESLRRFHEIYDFSAIYDIRGSAAARVQSAVPGRGQVSNIRCTGYISTENMKFMRKCMGASHLNLSVPS